MTDYEVFQRLKAMGYRVKFCFGGSIDIETPRLCILSQPEARQLLEASKIHGKIENLDSYGTRQGLNTWFDFSSLLKG